MQKGQAVVQQQAHSRSFFTLFGDKKTLCYLFVPMDVIHALHDYTAAEPSILYIMK